MSFLDGLFSKDDNKIKKADKKEKELKVLYKKANDYYGKEQFILKAGKVNALDLISSSKLFDKLTALERIIYEDPTIQVGKGNFEERILKLEDKIADMLAERSVEKDIEEQIAERMEKRQREYIKEIKKEIVNDDPPDNPETLRRLARLEKLDARSLNKSVIDLVRPKSLDEIVGQQRALKALVSKIASPYPQHVILYGPPGVGKTTAARLALEEAKKRQNTPFYGDSKFVEVDGATLRWDPREVTNPLLGSVHDPIYQGAKKVLAEGGVPEPKTGLVTEAHAGILFIDEIGELDPMLQNKLLKVMEDKRVKFESSYYDKNDENIPLYIKKLFEEGAPADFILIGATTRSPSKINPAFRSRCAEVFFNPLSREDIQQIVINAVKKLTVKIEDEIPEIISEYTTEGRTAINLLIDAYSLVLYENEGADEQELIITRDKLFEAIQNRRMIPHNKIKSSEKSEIGKVFGLGVNGYLGTVIEIEAVAFTAEEKGNGKLRFNETAGKMAKDSLFNAAAVIRKITGKKMKDYDLHVNIVGGGNVDGPSAGIAMLLALISAIEEVPLKQDIAVTGEVSIRGNIKPVSGIREKIYAAEQAGMREVLVPAENMIDIQEDWDIKVTPISTVEEALKRVLIDQDQLKLSII
ncbi:Lon family ATP-dependent protease [Halothermothrix orenii]|uniref:endopeptidase La n=1 Tax=Halothermothrix orenii (strain H 168 / OCM 544 / DSM 9562) TaxID=373903 RepID=B8D1C4_HALOH|nr:Lon family ATP-dependent protease [Halothermothrix orenii]ACL71076.1 Sporulation protease LonC [Halothermothrix orenii H 168]